MLEQSRKTPSVDVAKTPPPAPAAVLAISWLSNSTKVEVGLLSAMVAAALAAFICWSLKTFGIIAAAGSNEKLYRFLGCNTMKE